MRLRNNPNSLKALNESKYLIKNFPVFLNEDTVLEIGMGKGEMLTRKALMEKEKTFIGIEKFPTVAHQAMKKAKELNLENFFIICEDLKNLTESFKGKVNEIWLTFSDPWPKKRHYKRRLTYRTFLMIYKELLSSDGVLKIKTDNDSFFNWSIEEISEFGANIIFKTNDLHNSIKNENNIQTDYEKKWTQKGKQINYMEVKF